MNASPIKVFYAGVRCPWPPLGWAGALLQADEWLLARHYPVAFMPIRPSRTLDGSSASTTAATSGSCLSSPFYTRAINNTPFFWSQVFARGFLYYNILLILSFIYSSFFPRSRRALWGGWVAGGGGRGVRVREGWGWGGW